MTELSTTEQIQATVASLKDASGIQETAAVIAKLTDLYNVRLQEIQTAARYQDTRTKRLLTVLLDEKLKPLIDKHHSLGNYVQSIEAGNFDLKIAIDDAVQDYEVTKQELVALIGRMDTIEDKLDRHIDAG